MKASSYRNIKTGNEYNKYFKPAKMEVIDLPKGNVFYTLDHIQNIVLNTLDQTKPISKVLSNSDLRETLSNIWNFLYNHVQYKEDKAGVEQLRTPYRSWSDRKEGVDCDCYSVFISSILTNLKIQHSLRIAEYGSKGYYQHVYIVVPIDGVNIKGRNSYIVVDPVVNNFDYEVKYSKKHDKKMEIAHQVLNGLDTNQTSAFGSEFEFLNGLGTVSNNSFLNAIRDHLSNTLIELNKNKEQVAPIVNADVFKEQVTYVLENWNDPVARMAALLEMEEMEVLNEASPNNNGVGSFLFDDKALTKIKMLRKRRATQKRVVPALIKSKTMPSSILKYSKTGISLNGGLGGFFSKIKDTISNGVNKIGNGISNAAKSAADAAEDAARKAAEALKKYNPVSLAMRGGMLLALKLNLMQVTERLKYGYLSESEAGSRSVDMNEWRKAVDAKNKAEDFYVKILGGEAARFKQAVLNGKNGGLGEPVTMASATAAVTALLANIGNFLKNINFDKLKNGAVKVKDFITNNKELINTAATKVKHLIPTQADERPLPPNVNVPENQTPEFDFTPPNNEVAKPNKAKDNTMLYVVGGIGVAAIGGFIYYNSQKTPSKKAKSVNGTPRKRVKHAKI